MKVDLNGRKRQTVRAATCWRGTRQGLSSVWLKRLNVCIPEACKICGKTCCRQLGPQVVIKKISSSMSLTIKTHVVWCAHKVKQLMSMKVPVYCAQAMMGLVLLKCD